MSESGFFARDEPIAGLGMAPAVGERAFEMKEGEVSDPIRTPQGFAFCQHCGAAQALPATASEPPPLSEPLNAFCPSCGTKAEPGLAFCTKCGASLAVAAPLVVTAKVAKLPNGTQIGFGSQVPAGDSR